MLDVPDPSPVTFALAFAIQEYVIGVTPADTSVSSKGIVNCTSEHELAVPAIPIGSCLTISVWL